mgnify:CR=1 FL=1
MGLEVLRAGLQSTVQDQGRFGYAHFGVSASGAADNFSLRIGTVSYTHLTLPTNREV